LITKRIIVCNKWKMKRQAWFS